MKRMINLLPEERKEDIKIKIFGHFILRTGIVLVLAIFLFVLFLAANLFILSIYDKINQTEFSGEDKDEINKIIQESKNEIDNQHSKIKKLMASIKERKTYCEYLNQINQSLPEKAYLTEVSINEENISIKGLAENRDDLVSFKSSLEEIELFKKVDMPFSNFTSQENVNFEINLNLTEK